MGRCWLSFSCTDAKKENLHAPPVIRLRLIGAADARYEGKGCACAGISSWYGMSDDPNGVITPLGKRNEFSY
jgi:hypothetical protein